MKKNKKLSTGYPYITEWQQGMRYVVFCITILALPICSACARDVTNEYSFWKKIGRQVSIQAVRMIRHKAPQFTVDNCLALTNAGYAEINKRSTAGALDGLINVLRVGPGNHSLLELQSAADVPLWFAVYDKASGYVAYLEVNPAMVLENDAVHSVNKVNRADLFNTAVTEQVNAQHLYDNAALYADKFNNKIFNGNAFRIVTVANALSFGVSTTTVRAFQFHDHYCPGVTSGILMADYIKKYFSKDPGTRYFVQALQPWCKEDALLVLLDATPGKKSYSIMYPTEEDLASWPAWAKETSTVVYRYDPVAESWEGRALAFTWGENNCPDYGHAVMNKLCKDLQFIDQMDTPEKFVREVKRFALPQGVHPKEYARPGADLIALLTLLDNVL
ncbi:hypothetical protein VU04_04250 [Desulfobulbus sp. TB]|nr:hypothetical protein [Desulfobulbus sp. TB]